MSYSTLTKFPEREVVKIKYLRTLLLHQSLKDAGLLEWHAIDLNMFLDFNDKEINE